MAPSRDNNELMTLIQTMFTPLANKLAALEEKVDRLGQDRVTRTDIEKLRTELVGSFVPRDAFEPRHAALVERDVHLENQMREMRKEIQENIQRLEAGIKTQQDTQLSTKDRAWLRLSQALGVIGIFTALLDWISQHWK